MNTLFVGHNLLKFSSLSSTNDHCWELLSHKFPDGTVIWTPTQTQGKGQRRSWISEEENHYHSVFFLNQRLMFQAIFSQ